MLCDTEQRKEAAGERESPEHLASWERRGSAGGIRVMQVLAYATGIAVVMCLILATIALCAAAGRADAMAAVHHVDERMSRRGEEAGLVDDRTALDARKALRGRRAWVFSSSPVHAGLRLTGRGGATLPPSGEALALRVAGMAINADVPIIVPSQAGGPLDGVALVGVAVPFEDGRTGALVVAGAPGMAARPWITHVLQELAIERAELNVPAPPDQQRADRFTVARRHHAQAR
jgi:hypothetical protein